MYELRVAEQTDEKSPVPDGIMELLYQLWTMSGHNALD